MTALIVIGVLLLLLLLTPVEGRFSYDSGFSWRLWVGHIPIRLPEKKKKREKEKKTEKTPEKEAATFRAKTESLCEKVQLVKSLLKKFLKYSRRFIHVKKLSVSLSYGGSDAAVTAVSVGAFWSLLYSALALLTRVFTVDNHQFSVTPVYSAPAFCARAEGIIRTRIVHIIFIGLILLFQYKKLRKRG